MRTSLSQKSTSDLRGKLTQANTQFQEAYPGPSEARQPVHTVYGGAHLFSKDVAKKLSEGAIKSLEAHAPQAEILMKGLEISSQHSDLWSRVHSRVEAKLKSEAVEDFRIDFEDGYGNRPNAEEDSHAEKAALEVAHGLKAKSLPPFIGIRIKPFNNENVDRSLRTLDVFISTLMFETDKKIPENFVVTLPKVTNAEQSQFLAKVLGKIEKTIGLKSGSLKMELMVETPQSILDLHGTSPLRLFVESCEGRCRGLHFGTYDYTAGCQITAQYQAMDNPVCDFAKHVMQVSLAGTPVWLSDGATNIMPVGTTENVHRAWRLSFQHIRNSLRTGFYQGWDLHPAQLPIRYAAVYSFFLEGLAPAQERLKLFIEKAAKATLLGDVFDDAATGQGLLNFFLRGLSCGAVQMDEALVTGLTLEELQSRSFLKILENLKKI